ncbi:NAD(P)/FAD-dependent oxidoreductase [Oceanirhabdus sp. W0125-5]|uniref:NAD(P)/FAD-dependent oxidoreductase n=1 Tax=Oceanirhabdus sp. W0125-5 TaxID=2999116 RepID=UPI0022F30D48|nr:NAD(P)/FAD-dependent oxidoreductase [Oceanirhabdus sp. W0125-5]WBW97399.1 NAD(P)/FAD-dependent oxidoreductase [Oceanirhabdus sp. W0125-5]
MKEVISIGYINGIEDTIRKRVGKNVFCREYRSSIMLEGLVNNWEEVVKAGYIAAKSNYKGVINNLKYTDMKEIKYSKPKERDLSLEGKNYNVIIIGAGIIGCSIARELSKWDISILLLDKEEDVAMQTSSRNDGMIHPGFAPKVGSLKSKYNVLGNKLYTDISKELGVKINRCGSNMLFDKKWVKVIWPYIRNKSKRVGIEDVRKLGISELKEIEPNISEDIKWGVHIPSTAVTSPYKMTIAYAENAINNGVDIALNTMIEDISVEKNKIVSVKTNKGEIKTDLIVNAAGVFADEIADMAGDRFFTIHPRKGEIILLDKKKGHLLNSVIGKVTIGTNNSHSKGGGLVKTLEGNILVGPDAYEQPDKEDYSTNMSNVNNLLKKHLPLIKGLNRTDIITYCAGSRAATYKEDFLIEKSEYLENMIYAAGIQSPGFAAAPAISKEIERLTVQVLKKNLMVKKKEHWNGIRNATPNMMELTIEEKNQVIKKNPNYGTIVCRCEGISRGEIIDALKSPIPVRSVDGIKRRTRAGMGRCQGGFCMPLVMEIMEKEGHIPFKDITKKGGESKVISDKTKNNDEVEIHV